VTRTAATEPSKEQGNTMTAQEIVKSAIDAAGAAGGIYEVLAIAVRGPGNMVFSEDDIVTLVEAYGTLADALYAIQLEAQRRVSE
jgi:malonyl CoA-acyl carrier protein transacylase